MASSTEPESSGYHSESVHESELELQDRPSVARDLMDVYTKGTNASGHLSKAAAERVFSLLQNSFNHRQDHSFQDYLERS